MGTVKTLRGTSKVLCVATVLLSVSLTHIEARAQSVTLNLKDADIGAVIATVADVTGRNFIVDPRVKAKVTVISARPMNKDEVYQVFLSLLEVNGFAAVPVGKVIKIIPDTNAKQSTAPVTSDDKPGRGDEYVTRVIHLKNVSAAQLVPVLRPLSPQQAHMVAYPGTNALIIADRAANIERLAKIVEDIDQPGEDAEVEVMALRHAAAAEVTRILMALDQEARKIDPAGAAGVVDRPVLIADERTNSILMGGGKSGRLRMRALVSHLDTPLETSGNIRVIYLRYAKAKDLVPVLTGVASQVQDKARGAAGAAPSPAGSGPPGSGINIQADESTNALVITAPPDVFRSLQVVISQLDVRRAQVLVEAVIAEVTTSRAAELGVQWGTFDRAQGASNPVGLTNFTNGTAGSSIAEIGASIARNTPPAIGPGMTFGLGRFVSDGFSFAALVRALQSDGSSNVLSTPTLVTMDNADAEIVVGQNVPFITGAFATPVAGAGATPVNPFQTIQRQNVGLTLKIKPQINEGNAIKMDIEQKVDSLSTTAVRGAADLITNTRSIKTSVMIDDGKVVVLGGLITEDMKENVQKVPLLGDIPLLGNLFRYKRNSKDKTNLMVFLHPVIMRDGELTERMTGGKYNFIRATQIDAKLKDRGLLRDEPLPMLPPMDELMKLPPPFEAGSGKTTPADGRTN